MQADWIAVDWGTSNLRAYAMGSPVDGKSPILARAQSDQGMGQLSRDQFEPALLALIADWLPAKGTVRVLACGMVGSRQGWHEAPYRPVPCPPLNIAQMVAVPVQDSRLNVWIAPGLSQQTPADVMRGEETQIAGALALYPDFDGVICLPGTHSKWCRISAGEVVGFQTYFTGEMFALLSTQSVLRHGIGTGWDDPAFETGLSEGMSHPDRLLAQLFRLRAEGLLAGLSPDATRARLSGLLIGAEIAAARGWWLGLPVVLIGSAGVCAHYARALMTQGAKAQVLDAAECTIAGLAQAAGHWAKGRP